MFFLTAGNLKAQIRLGAGVGFNSFNIQLIEEIEGHKGGFLSGDNFALWGNQIGIAGEKALNDKWATHLAVVYSWQNTINVNKWLETNLDYIKVQPMVKFSGFTPEWMQRIYVKGGIYYGYAVRGVMLDYTGENVDEIRLRLGSDNCIKKTSDLGLATEVGVQINRVQVGVLSQAGFLNTSNVKGVQETYLGWGVHLTYLFFQFKKRNE